MFQRIVRKFVHDAQKEIESNPDLVKGLMDSVGNALAGGRTGTMQGNPAQASSELPLMPEASPEDAGSGDLVLDSYYALLAEARAQKNLKGVVQYAQLIQDREGQLQRSERASKAARARHGQSSAAELPASAGVELDINNLAPHADEIAAGIIDLVAGLGFDKSKMKLGAFDIAGILQQNLAAEIKKRPAIIPEALGKFQGLLQNVAGARATGSQVAQQAQLDPTHPEQWAHSLGFGK